MTVVETDHYDLGYLQDWARMRVSTVGSLLGKSQLQMIITKGYLVWSRRILDEGPEPGGNIHNNHHYKEMEGGKKKKERKQSIGLHFHGYDKEKHESKVEISSA